MSERPALNNLDEIRAEYADGYEKAYKHLPDLCAEVEWLRAELDHVTSQPADIDTAYLAASLALDRHVASCTTGCKPQGFEGTWIICEAGAPLKDMAWRLAQAYIGRPLPGPAAADEARRPTVREACRRRMPLDGADAQALEHALTITERERDAARAKFDLAHETLASDPATREAFGEEWKSDTAKMLDEVTRERDEAREWVRRLLAENVTTCVFCGHAYPPGTPTHGVDALRAHIDKCPKHPIAGVRAEVARLTAERDALRPKCDVCGSTEIEKKTTEESFPYGDVTLIAKDFEVTSCRACGMATTGVDGEAARSEAVVAHLQTMVASLRDELKKLGERRG